MEEITEAFDSADKINIYNDSVKNSYSAGSSEFKTVAACWNEMAEGSHQMPAFGVSINNYTLTELQKGVWLELEYPDVVECWEMPFKKLLIKVEKNWFGFNLIRYNADTGYDGRCFYLDLAGKNMDNLYDLLRDISK